MATATNGTTNISYAYDANGLRTSKVVNGVTHNYLYASGQLMRKTYGNNVLDFFYDASGNPYALKYNGTTYYYITNLQGDVMYLIDANENTVAAYEYDPYGNIVSATGTMAEINPLRYRGYYYDAELDMYYLQSRYYDPTICRFINADDMSLLGVSETVLGYNLFSYCLNNPVNMSDVSGDIPVWIVYAAAGAALFGGVTYIIGKALGITGRALAVLTTALAAVGATAAAILGVKFLAKISPKLAKWAETVAKNTKVLKPSYSHKTGQKSSLGGLILFDAFKIMLHPPHNNQHNYFHIQIELKLPGVKMPWTKFRIKINPTKWIS